MTRQSASLRATDVVTSFFGKSAEVVSWSRFASDLVQSSRTVGNGHLSMSIKQNSKKKKFVCQLEITNKLRCFIVDIFDFDEDSVIFMFI